MLRIAAMTHTHTHILTYSCQKLLIEQRSPTYWNYWITLYTFLKNFNKKNAQTETRHVPSLLQIATSTIPTFVWRSRLGAGVDTTPCPTSIPGKNYIDPFPRFVDVNALAMMVQPPLPPYDGSSPLSTPS